MLPGRAIESGRKYRLMIPRKNHSFAISTISNCVFH